MRRHPLLYLEAGKQGPDPIVDTHAEGDSINDVLSKKFQTIYCNLLVTFPLSPLTLSVYLCLLFRDTPPLPSQSSLDVIYGSFPDGLGAKRAWRRSRFGEGAIDELLYIQVTLHNVMYRNVDEMTSLLESGVRGEAATRLKFDHRDFDWDDTTVVVQAKAKFCNRTHGCYEPPAHPKRTVSARPTRPVDLAKTYIFLTKGQQQLIYTNLSEMLL